MPKKVKYEARIYLGKELYQEVSKLVSTGVFRSVNQAIGEMVKSGTLLETIKTLNATLERGKQNGE